MSFDLSAVAIREPAVLIRDPLGTPAYFWAQKAFDLVPQVEYFNVESSTHAIAEKRIKSLYWEINTTLVGEFEHLPQLFPLLSSSLGASVLGTTDVAWRLVTQSGRQWDFPRAGIIERPQITSVAGQTLFGACKFAAVCASDADPGDEGAFYTYNGSGTFPGFGSFDPSKIITLSPLLTYSGLFSSAQAEQGVQITLKWDTMEFRANNLIRDWTVKAQEHTAKVKPYGIAFDDIADACGYNSAMGAALPTQTFTAQYNGFYFELRGATCEQAQFKLGPESDFIDGLVFRASQLYSGGSQITPVYLDTSD